MRRQLLRLRLGGRVRPGEMFPACTRAAARAGSEIQVAPRSRPCHRRPSRPEAAAASRRSSVRDHLFTPERLALPGPERIILTYESGRDSACGDHGGSVRNGGADRSEIHAQKADRHRARHVWGCHWRVNRLFPMYCKGGAFAARRMCRSAPCDRTILCRRRRLKSH